MGIEKDEQVFLKLARKTTTHLSRPENECITGSGNTSINAFGGRYTKRKCQLTKMMLYIYKKCHKLPYMYYRWFPKDWEGLYGPYNISNTNTWCDGMWLRKFGEIIDSMIKSSCLTPCFEVEYDIQIHQYKRKKRKYWECKEEKCGDPFTEVRVNYRTFAVTSIVERYEYTFPQILSSLGGTLGLCMGCSALSFVEVF